MNKLDKLPSTQGLNVRIPAIVPTLTAEVTHQESTFRRSLHVGAGLLHIFISCSSQHYCLLYDIGTLSNLFPYNIRICRNMPAISDLTK